MLVHESKVCSFLWGSNSPCMDRPATIKKAHSSAGGCLGSFQSLAVMSKASVNIHRSFVDT